MIVLTIRTDKPEAELGLYKDAGQLAHYTWHAHRQLAETVHQKIAALLENNGYSLQDLTGIICYKGPGSFTGLRIGLTVANSLAYVQKLPIVATSGDDWQQLGLQRLEQGDDESMVLPEYGAPVHITQQKK